MKKTEIMKCEFGVVNIWGSDNYGYTIQLVKPADRNLISDKDYLAAARKWMCVQKYASMDVLKDNLERFMGLGVYGMFNIVKHTDKTISLSPKRYIPQDVKDKYRAQKQAQADASKAKALPVSPVGAIFG